MHIEYVSARQLLLSYGFLHNSKDSVKFLFSNQYFSLIKNGIITRILRAFILLPGLLCSYGNLRITRIMHALFSFFL